MGPTASGKSSLAESLAERMNGELISVDSALVYRGLDIGAAKPESPHHLMQIHDPAEPYNAAEFARDARICIGDIRARSKQPILVGGSMLYYRALIHGFHELPQSEPVVRAEIESEAASRGWPALHAELLNIDPLAAQRCHPNHSHRILRALEVFRISGRPMSDWQSGSPEMDNETYLCVGLCPRDRADLHARIESRLENMFARGLVAEVRTLFNRGDLGPHLPAIRAVGYRQIWSHLLGEISLDESRHQTLVATRKLAKRQITWLKSWPHLVWLFTDRGGQLTEVRSKEAALDDILNPPEKIVSGGAVQAITELMRNFWMSQGS